jgi:putative SOS response-associated peptidase YedK
LIWLRQLAKAIVGKIGTLPHFSGIFPAQIAPVVMTRPSDGQRELLMMRCGFPSPGAKGPLLVTNVRNTQSRWWKPYLVQAQRCLVPVTSFCEYDHSSGKGVPTWFALDDTRPLFFFAGIWRSWVGTRGTKANPVEGNHLLSSFLTTEPNAEVGTVHEKAMPDCLLTEADRETWMQGENDEALALQKPARDGTLKVVAKGIRRDG